MVFRGILSLAWCPCDSDLLLSCGKDNRILCWNPNTESRAGEVCPTLLLLCNEKPLADGMGTQILPVVIYLHYKIGDGSVIIK